MSARNPIRTEQIEVNIRLSKNTTQGAIEIQSEELVATSLTGSDKTKVVWFYLPSTLPSQPTGPNEVGEYTPVCLKFQSIKKDGKNIKAVFRQGFIRANNYGVTDFSNDFERYEEWTVQIDLQTGKEISKKTTSR